jgi:2-polyprenyl-6-methoxyphenol hydroxylase-like FAD-dependent oxidoreductase
VRALVIGAGPAGLTATLVLRRAGWDVHLVEEAPELRTQGFAVPVHERGCAVLTALGLRPATTGPVEMPRGDLVRLLAGEVLRLGGLDTGVRAQDLVDLFGDYDVVLGADGIDSPTRALAGFPDGRRATGFSLALYRDDPAAGPRVFPTGEEPGGTPWRVDEITQIELPHWSRGHVMLIGDAAAACGAATGFSTTVALVMAYQVANALVAGRTPAEVEARLRPWVTEQQAAARRRLPA